MGGASVLVALDGSPMAEAALPLAEAVASATGAPLCLVGVVAYEGKAPAEAAAVVPLEAHTPLEMAELASMEEYLELLAAERRAAGMTVATMVKLGDPAAQILLASREDDAGVVVMATHGRAGVRRLLEGSIVDEVLRGGTRPVLIVAAVDGSPSRRTVALQQLLVPLDGSSLAETALAQAIRLASARTALLLARVEPHATGDANSEAHAYLERVRGALPPDVDAETRVLSGTPAQALLAFARSEAVDLIVLSTHGRGGLRRLVLGSTADQIIRSGVPVLIVPPAAGIDVPHQPPSPARQERP